MTKESIQKKQRAFPVFKSIFPNIQLSENEFITIDLNKLNDIVETEYGKFLRGLFLKEWELLNRKMLIEIFENEHADSLAMIMENESQKLMLRELNDRLNELLKMHEKDMKMASNVQRALLAVEPPSVTNYDIALHYQPCASVSGDFYDFYVDRNTQKISGLVLADVSGHGIASGLLTIMARPIFFREFIQNRGTSLNSVLDRINAKLIKQMEASENYITGIMLRFNDNSIEYCNSAHPDILLRSQKTGLTAAIKAENRPIQGSLMGIAAVATPFTTHRFDVECGDIVVIYTDCLTECRDRSGNEFGESGIARVLADNWDKCSEEIMKSLLASIYEFNGSQSFKDDLTVIILKKI